MKTQFIVLFTIFIMGSVFSQENDKIPDQWSEKELAEWFNNGEWKTDWDVHPDESINQRAFARLYFQNHERWDKAFQFLSEQNLSELAPGRYELEGADLFVNVDEYITRNEEDVLFEAHKKYADIQVVVSGKEKIGILPLERTTTEILYNEEKDIMFLTANTENYRIAESGKFFLFFPDDAHRPKVKVAENIPVRKVVVKVRLN